MKKIELEELKQIELNMMQEINKVKIMESTITWLGELC